MQVPSQSRLRFGRRRGAFRAIAGLGAAATVLTLAACSSSSSSPTGPKSQDTARSQTSSMPSSTPTPTPTPSATPAIITTSAVSTKTINPTTPVTISIDHGTLTSVVMRNAAGTDVRGRMSPDGSSWKNTEVLGYGKTYTVVARGKNAEGTPVTKRSKVTTLTPGNQTAISLERMGGYALTKGATYGVAIVPEIQFDESISSAADKAAAEKAITVQTSPQVTGAWAWTSDTTALWRPEHYWPSGTKVTINANIYGVKLGDGLYGQSDESTSFTIGRKQLTVADDTTNKAVPRVFVYNAAGKLLRKMYTAFGEHSGETVNGNYINFYTLNGTYTVLEHDNPAQMCSASYGLPATAPGGYACEPIYWSTKISTDGIYLHQLNNTRWAQLQGDDVSHGCLNLDQADATWFYKHSLIGDPVEIKGNKKAPNLQVWEGGAWSVTWAKWKTGDIS